MYILLKYLSENQEYEKHYKIKLNEDDIKTLSVLFNRGWTSGYINEVKFMI